MQYKDFIIKWLEEKESFVKKSTYESYTINVYNHIIPKLGNYNLEDLTHDILQNFITDLSRHGNLYDTKKGLSTKTIKDIMMIVKNSIKDAMNKNLVNYINFSFRYPKKESKEISILSDLEKEKICHEILKNPTNKNIGILLGLCCGLRIGEVCGLKWKDIDLNNGILKINNTLQRIYSKKDGISKISIDMPKTNNAKREIPITNELTDILNKIKGDNEEFVLTNSEIKHYEPRTYRRIFEKELERININIKERGITFHSLRHTFATSCVSNTKDYKTISALLGHSNINITLEYYVHPSIKEKRECITAVNGFLINIK